MASAEADLEQEAKDIFHDLTGGKATCSAGQFKEALGDLLGEAVPKENLAAILETLVTIIDAEETGTITERQFVGASRLFITMANGESPLSEPDIFFDMLDSDKSGEISSAELQKTFRALLPKGTDPKVITDIVDELMAAGDSSGDGQLSREEVRGIAEKLQAMF